MQRYSFLPDPDDRKANMVMDADGDYVPYSDALPLEKRVKELEAALRGMLAHVREMDEAGQEHCACSRCQSARKLLEAPHEP